MNVELIQIHMQNNQYNIENSANLQINNNTYADCGDLLLSHLILLHRIKAD